MSEHVCGGRQTRSQEFLPRRGISLVGIIDLGLSSFSLAKTVSELSCSPKLLPTQFFFPALASRITDLYHGLRLYPLPTAPSPFSHSQALSPNKHLAISFCVGVHLLGDLNRGNGGKAKLFYPYPISDWSSPHCFGV